MSKVCPTCKEEKEASEFYSRGKAGLYSKCKECFNAYCIKRWIQKKLDAIKHLGGKCVDCKKSYHYSVYDFHHLDEKEKDFDWGKLRLMAQKTINKELAKCVLLCSNCHRLRHHQKE